MTSPPDPAVPDPGTPGRGGVGPGPAAPVDPRPRRLWSVGGAFACWVLTAVATVVHLMRTLGSSFWQSVLDSAQVGGVDAGQLRSAVALTRWGTILIAAAAVTLYLFFAVMMLTGRHWARVVLTVLGGLTVWTWLSDGTVSMSVSVEGRGYHAPGVSPWLTGVLAVVAVALMYLPAGNAYFRDAARWRARRYLRRG